MSPIVLGQIQQAVTTLLDSLARIAIASERTANALEAMLETDLDTKEDTNGELENATDLADLDLDNFDLEPRNNP